MRPLGDYGRMSQENIFIAKLAKYANMIKEYLKQTNQTCLKFQTEYFTLGGETNETCC
jgi:hypothetical protein